MFKISTQGLKEDSGIVYVLEFELEDRLLVKVGMTQRKVEERVCEILVSMWKRYRVFPRCYVKRYRSFGNPFEIEAILHRVLKEYSYETKYVFSGSTEMFNAPLDLIVDLYEVLHQGGTEEDVQSKLQEYERVQTDGIRESVSNSRLGHGNAEMVVSFERMVDVTGEEGEDLQTNSED